MTAREPERRFLGLDPAATPEQLLGFDAGPPRDRLAIESALRDRLDLIFRHPAGRSADAERLRRRLRDAAAALSERTFGTVPPRPPRPPRRAERARRVTAGTVTLELTEFDRHALAVLVGCGGWNAESRGRLVALASAYGVSAEGLVRIVTGLSDYARAGGSRLGVEEITSGSERMAPPGSIDVDPGLRSGALAALAERAAPELRDGELWSTVKLSALFGLLTMLVGLAALRVVFPDRGGGPTEDAIQGPAVLPGGSAKTGAAAGEVGPRADVATGDRDTRALQLDREPGFRGNAVPAEAADAADACAAVPRDLDLVARKLSVDSDLSEAAYRSWALAIETAATGWVLADASTRTAVRREILGVLHEAADAPDTTERLLGDLVPALPAPGRPLDVWRGAFRAGVLGTIANNDALPPAIVARAAALRRAATTADDDPSVPGFDEAAGRWLDAAAPVLAAWTEPDLRSFDAWEMWLAAQRAVRAGARLDAALLGAATHVLAGPSDLAAAGPALDVLARLLAETDLASTPAAREAVLALFDDERCTSTDLWVLTSLLARDARLAWFGEGLVLPATANSAFRRRVHDRMAAAWPVVVDGSGSGPSAPRGIEVDATVAARWRALLRDAVSGALPRRHEELMAELLLAARINEAAALLADRRPERADRVLELVERDLAARRERRALVPGTDMRHLLPAGARTGPRGQATGRDEVWADAYEEAGRSTEERLTRLRALRSRAGGDLGPRDAEVFVRAVYRGAPHDVRELARGVLIQQFTRGPVVALQMLDQFPDAPRNESVSETIRRMTGQVLPSTRSESWPRDARLALARHVLALRETGGVIDGIAARLTESYAVRLAAARRDGTATMGLPSPQEAARRLADAWLDRARAVIAPEPAPADVPGLERRRRSRGRIADGPAQGLVVHLVGVLDAFTYVLVAERPERRDEALGVLRAAAADRASAWHVVEQAIASERALSRLWALRIVPTAGEEMVP